MSFGLFPSARGIEGGLRIGMMLEDRKDRKEDRMLAREDRARRHEMENLNKQLATMNLERLMDSQFREQARDRLYQAQYAAQSLHDRAKAGEQITPEQMREVQQMANSTIDFVMRDFINQGNEPGQVKHFDGWVIGQDGKTAVPRLRIENEGMDPYMAPMTPNRTKDDQTVMSFPVEDAANVIPFLTGLIDEIDGKLVGVGDRGPIERRDAARQAQAAEELHQRRRGEAREDKMWEWENKPTDSADWALTSLGDGRFVQHNKRTGETRVPTPEELESILAGGGGSGTQNAKRYEEMRSLGVPDEVARGVAYGVYKTVSDPVLGTTMIVDLATGQPVGGFEIVRDADGRATGVEWKSQVQQPRPAPARVEGAQQSMGLMWPSGDQGLGVGEARRPPPGAPQQQGAPRTAINPQTGERLILQNGQWVPMTEVQR